MAFKERVFSGMQPTGSLHLGNYLGAMINWIELQKTHECIYCVVDMHAITVWQDPAELKQAIRQVTAAYIASGLDPKKSILFNQSQVPEHAELAWVFNCVARLGWLNRMTQFKEAWRRGRRARAGLWWRRGVVAAAGVGRRASRWLVARWQSGADGATRREKPAERGTAASPACERGGLLIAPVRAEPPSHRYDPGEAV